MDAVIIDYTNTRAVMQEYAKKAAEIYKRQLAEHGRNATKELINSVHTEVRVGKDTIAVDMDLASYWKYVEWDTRPHWAPPGVLERWIVAKRLVPMRDSRLPERKQIAQLDYLIRRKIAKEGTQGTHDLATTVELLNREYYERIVEALTLDVTEAFDKVFIRTFERI
ncbi:MAG: hypothetical protein KBS70_08730 [Bacteroidales bacterium]|nr:hypothetical protein [Candidatus Colicola equi]